MIVHIRVQALSSGLRVSSSTQLSLPKSGIPSITLAASTDYSVHIPDQRNRRRAWSIEIRPTYNSHNANQQYATDSYARDEFFTTKATDGSFSDLQVVGPRQRSLPDSALPG